MLIVDIVVLIALLGFIGNGWRAGAIETLGRVLGAVIGYLVAKSYTGWLVGIVGLFVPKTWAFLVSFVIVFLVVDHIVGLLFHIVEGILKVVTWLPIIKQINGLIGAIFGFIEGIIVIGGIAWLISHVASVDSAFITSSRILPHVNTIFAAVFAKLL
jgi:uncharacterized membrane protein required for colicin V production